MVLRPEKEAEAKAVFDKWDLDFAIVGETIPEDRFLVMMNGEVKADLPLKALSGEAPEYDRPWEESAPPPPLGEVPEVDPAEALLRIAGHPNHGSRAWVWEQYDTTVGADTTRRPGSDAGVVRVHGTGKALAFTADVTPRYCRANPVEGGRQAVAEAYRNLVATGATPLAVTDNLNFGNPEKPAIMGQLVGCIRGIGEACAALGTPVVSGNVSLYNETDGAAILPTPTIGAVGLIRTPAELIGTEPRDGDALVLLGAAGRHLGASAFAAVIMGDEGGDAPHVELGAEVAAARAVHAARDAGVLHAAHDVSEGGIALAALEMALAGRVGVTVELEGIAALFGEDQGRYLLAVPEDGLSAALEAAAAAGAPASRIGAFGGETVTVGGRSRPLEAFRDAHARALDGIVT